MRKTILSGLASALMLIGLTAEAASPSPLEASTVGAAPAFLTAEVKAQSCRSVEGASLCHFGRVFGLPGELRSIVEFNEAGRIESSQILLTDPDYVATLERALRVVHGDPRDFPGFGEGWMIGGVELWALRPSDEGTVLVRARLHDEAAEIQDALAYLEMLLAL